MSKDSYVNGSFYVSCDFDHMNTHLRIKVQRPEGSVEIERRVPWEDPKTGGQEGTCRDGDDPLLAAIRDLIDEFDRALTSPVSGSEEG